MAQRKVNHGGKERTNHVFALIIYECFKVTFILLLMINFKGLKELLYPVNKDHSNHPVANDWSDL